MGIFYEHRNAYKLKQTKEPYWTGNEHIPSRGWENEAMKFLKYHSMKFKTRKCPNCDSGMARHIFEDIVKYNPFC